MRRMTFGEGAVYRLAAGAVECDAVGPRVGGIPLLRRTGLEAGAPRWRLPPPAEIEDDLSRVYGRPIGAAGKLGGLGVVADALTKGQLARAQIATLLLRLPDPPPPNADAARRAELEKRLGESGLLKDWNPDAHPRVGVPPNPGWFAPKGEAEAPRPIDIAFTWNWSFSWLVKVEVSQRPLALASPSSCWNAQCSRAPPAVDVIARPSP